MSHGFTLRYQFRDKMHLSWFVAWLSIALLGGIAFAPNANDSFVGPEWLVVGLGLVLVILVSRAKYMILLAIMAGIIFGLWRGSNAHDSLQAYTSYFGKTVTLQGKVSEDTSYGTHGDLRIRISDVRIDHRDLPGTIWVSSSTPMDIKRGDVVTIQGLINKGFGNIPASMFRAKVEAIVRPTPGDIGRQVRDWFAVGVYRAMPADNANLALAYLVGQRLTVSETLSDQLRTVGLIHAVVASGYHLTVLVGVVRRVFLRASKYLSVLMSAGMISGFIMITGFSPSMSRAGLVSGLSLAAWYYGRVVHPLVLLPFAAAITAIIRPEYVWGDVGWYLSFMAFTGVILCAPLIHRYFWGKKQPGILREILVATVAAQLLTLPLVLHTFGYYSIYALLANLLVVPLIPLTMLLTFISGIISLSIPAFAWSSGAPVRLILEYMTSVVQWIAHLPGAKTEVHFEMPALVLAYVGIAVLLVFLWRSTEYDFRSNNSEKLL
jgi:competence protein ComEC